MKNLSAGPFDGGRMVGSGPYMLNFIGFKEH